MMKFRKEKKERPHIEITSLIDIIFILLIFFMISSTFLKPVVKIKLPVSAVKEKVKKKKIPIFLTNDDRLFFNKKEINIKSLQYFVEKELDKNSDSDAVVLLNCDEDVVFKKVILVMDILKNSGVKNVAISHKPEK